MGMTEAEIGDQQDESSDVTGPHGWLNWQAERAGQPARSTSKTEGILVRPLWEEYALYSDARIVGEFSEGPYTALITFPPAEPAVGRSQRSVIWRVRDHLEEAPPDNIDWERQDVSGYYGGDLGDEFAALLSLALSRRMRSGGLIRHGMDRDPLGSPFEARHQPPTLEAPRGSPMIPGIGEESKLENARELLLAYSLLSGEQAIVVARAAQQYADALWWADADPRIAWIKLIGALETASNLWAKGQEPDPLAQMKRWWPDMHRRLERVAPAEAVEATARELKGFVGAAAKFVDFTASFLPNPPPTRPVHARVDWDDLGPALRVIYRHRSRDLHDGIPFPDPLCRAPTTSTDGIHDEAFSAIASAGGGGVWRARDMPMHLHVLAYIAGGALRNWWRQLGEEAQQQRSKTSADSAEAHATGVWSRLQALIYGVTVPLRKAARRLSGIAKRRRTSEAD
jgi:hypothetical protein